MQDLKELALMVQPLELKATVRNLLFFEGDTMLSKFYQALVGNEFDSDETALRELYPDDPTTTNSYRKLKSTLKKRLKDAILLFDEKNHTTTEYQKAYCQSYKEWAMVKILLGRNARSAAVEIALGILKKAKKFEFTDLAMDVTSVLRLHYGARLGDKNKFNHYNALFKQYRALYFLEEEAQEAYIDLIINYVNNRSPKSQQHDRAILALEVLDSHELQGDSHQYKLYRYLIELMAATTIYDYRKAMAICEDAIEYFSGKKYEANLPLQIFYYQELVCHVQLGQFEEGKIAAEKCSEYILEGSFNWFKYQELYLILALYTGQYSEAARAYLYTVNHTRFEFLPDNAKEVWKIYHAYLYFLSKIEKIEEEDLDEAIDSSFKLGKFLNEVMIFSKDKSGLNAAILIAQILILISEGRHEETIDRMETTQQYCYRYLKTEYTQRTYLFLKMLLKIPHLGFEREVIVQKTQKIKEQLQKVPLEVANQAVEIEIIPFETLWEMLLESLDKRE